MTDRPEEPVSEAQAETAHRDPVTHMDSHTVISDDDHGPAEAALGPIDWGAWLYAIVGVVAGLVVVAGFWIALN